MKTKALGDNNSDIIL